MGPNQKKAMEYLQANPDGATTKEIQGMCRCNYKQAKLAVASIPHKYIDRWTWEGRQLVEVWCLSPITPDAPHPYMKDPE